MNGKVIVVTGGSSGMGKYMAKQFAEQGAHVVITVAGGQWLNQHPF